MNLTDDDMYPGSTVITLPVPYAVMAKWSGGKDLGDGTFTFAPRPVELKRHRLTLGGVDLGDWVIESITGSLGRSRRTVYLVTMRRMEET